MRSPSWVAVMAPPMLSVSMIAIRTGWLRARMVCASLTRRRSSRLAGSVAPAGAGAAGESRPGCWFSFVLTS
jgi:hypothetical protein